MKLKVGRYYQHRHTPNHIIELVHTFKVSGGKRIFIIKDNNPMWPPALVGCLQKCKYKDKCVGGCSDEKYLRKNYIRVPDLVGILNV
jgi:hypothetical protein